VNEQTPARDTRQPMYGLRTFFVNAILPRFSCVVFFSKRLVLFPAVDALGTRMVSYPCNTLSVFVMFVSRE
jgi:hypothetical protein